MILIIISLKYFFIYFILFFSIFFIIFIFFFCSIIYFYSFFQFTYIKIAFLFYLFLVFVFCCVLLVAAFKSCRWLYNTVKMLRKFTTTTFSPIAAAICTLIPGFCGIFDYYIFKDILNRQEKMLAQRKAKFVAPAPGILKWILMLSVVSLIPSVGYEQIALRMLSLALIVSAAVVYIKVMTVIIENEKTLSIIRERELLERKVDEILAQREKQ